MAERRLTGLQQLVVCPVCKGSLEFSSTSIRCVSCERRFSQASGEYLDLLPHDMAENKDNQWEERQQEMEQWYHNLLAKPTAARNCFLHDYTPYAPILATMFGDILDVGGGVGIVRDYLPHGGQYTVIDPSLDWLGTEWTSLAKSFPSLKEKPQFVRGIGEYLPFQAQAFDAVLALWSLNHVNYPEQVFSEVHRVLRPNGRFLVVLEDMPPTWGDIADGTFRASEVAPGGGDPSMENPAHPTGRGWPLQSDHLRIVERDIRAWTSGRFEITRREWIGSYLTFEVRKIEYQQDTPTQFEGTEVQQDEDEYRIHMQILQNERSEFVRRLQAYEQQILELNSTLLEESQKSRRLRKRVRNLNRLLNGQSRGLNAHQHNVWSLGARRLWSKLQRIRATPRKRG